MNRRFVPRLSTAVIAAALAAPALAADGDLDTSFGNQGFRPVAFDYGADKADRPEDLVALADGGFVAVGRARKANGAFAAVSVRLNANGSLVTGYGDLGKRRLFAGNDSQDQVFTAAAQIPDGRIVFVGYAETPFAADNIRNQALLVLGDEDTAGVFNVKIDNFPSVTTEFTGVTVDCLGRAVGTGVWNDGDGEFHAKRYLPSMLKYDTGYALSGDSIIPLDFASGGGFDASTAAIHLPDDTLLQGGFAQIAGSDYDFAAVRSLQNGDFDEQGFGAATYSFDIAGSNKNDRVRAMLIDPQGRVLIAGEAARGANGVDTDIALVRLKSNLAPDPDFGTNGRLVISFDIFDQTARDELGGIAVAPDGKILVVGTHFPGDAANVSDVALVRLEDDGDADFAFGTFGREFYDFGNGATQKDVGVDVVVTDSRVVVLSQREFDGADTDFVVFGVVNTVPPKPDPLFKNGFE